VAVGCVKAGSEADVYEVFVQYGDKPNAKIEWVGNVRASDPMLAWHAAKEAFTRREACSVLWVSPRNAMIFSTSEDTEILRTSQRLGYRAPGFPGGHRRARSIVATIQPIEPAEL
jgi:1,2-phenylacetyl-CoA epoxidase PaaB subunit